MGWTELWGPDRQRPGMCDGPPHPRARKIPLSSCEAARLEVGRGGAEAESREKERNLLKMTFRIDHAP